MSVLQAPVVVTAPRARGALLTRLASQWDREVLALIVAVHVVMTLTARAVTTVFEDEALHLYIGHRMIAHLLDGATVIEQPGTSFTGAPALYPVVGALADSVAGLDGARALAAVFTSVVIICVHGLTRTLYGPGAAVAAAAIVAVNGSFVLIGHFATHDATMLAWSPSPRG